MRERGRGRKSKEGASECEMIAECESAIKDAWKIFSLSNKMYKYCFKLCSMHSFSMTRYFTLLFSYSTRLYFFYCHN